jgi:CHAD domain-containing protein
MNTPVTEESKPNARQLLAEALEKAWDNYRKELKNCRDEFSNEAIHDLRVATRRVLAIIELLKSIEQRPRFKKIIRELKDQLDELDDLRDTQVILAEISEVLNELPQLHPFQKELQTDEEKLLRTLRKKIKKFETSDLEKRIAKTQASLEDNESENDLESKVLQAVDDAYQLAKERLAWVDATRAATIHRVRVAFKSLRYMIEIIYPLFRDYPEENLKRMDGYQSLMGEVQDREVFMQTLADYAESASFPDMETVRRYYEQRHNEAISAYMKNMNDLQTFWRPAPDQPFPWEKHE